MIKVIDTTSRINCINFGPFDNGHVMVGLSDGYLLAFSYPKLERLESIKVFDN